MKHIILIFCILFLCNSAIYANDTTEELDSLLKLYTVNDNTADQNIRILTKIGELLKYNNPDSALHYYSLAYEIADLISNKKQIVTLLNRIGDAKYRLGEYDESLDYFTRALSISRNSNSKTGIANGLNNIGIILGILERNEEAIKNHLNSILLCNETEDSLMLGINYFNLSLIYTNTNSYDTALMYAEKSVKINKLLNNQNELLKLNTLVGNIYNGKGDYLLAEKAFHKVINSKVINNNWELSYALAGLSLAEQKLGNFERSISYGLESLLLAKEINAKWDIQNVTKILSTSYALKSDYKNAYSYFKEFKLYSDSIFNEEKENKINYLSLKQDDFEYILLSKENEINTERIQKKNNLMLLFALGILFLVLLAIFLYRTNFQKSKLNKQLNAKNIEIDKKNKQLVQLNATKDTFFRIIGHDLKSPMSTVVSFTDLLQHNYNALNKDEILEYIDITKRAALDTVELLDNILEWAKAQTGITNITLAKTNIQKLIAECTDKSQSSILAKKIKLTVDVDNNLEVIIDKNMTASILRNLLTNAIKFTNLSGEINISARASKAGVLFRVSDDGVGMSKEKVVSLFKIEHASSTPGTNQEKGTGIGLILCKEFTDKQGGTIWAESEQGKGSIFYFRV